MRGISNSGIFTTIIILHSFLYSQKPGTVESAISCNECHEEIYNQWSKSRHARSTPVNNILFANIYQLSRNDTDDQTKLYCIRCHAPVTQINGDVDLIDDITNEGITCDICHSITGFTDDPSLWPNIYNPGEVKRGPHKDTEPEEHKVVYSELFENSRICSGCHGDMLDIPGTRSCGNLTICNTDFEWKQTTFANEGKSCVDCHMTRTTGQISSKKEKRFQHDFSGAYSPVMLKKAVDLDLYVKEFEGDVIANIQITNKGTTHLLPTGPPARLVFLKVSAFNHNGEEVWSNFIDNPALQDPYGVFHIVFADQGGKVPSMPWLASKIVKDTRLRPGERRRLVYKFPTGDVTKVSAKLYYRLAPPPLLNKFEIDDEILRKPYLMAQIDRLIAIN